MADLELMDYNFYSVKTKDVSKGGWPIPFQNLNNKPQGEMPTSQESIMATGTTRLSIEHTIFP